MSAGFRMPGRFSRNAGRPSVPPAPTRGSRGFPRGAASSPGDPEERLVLDPRGGVTPSQMVDQKLLALLEARRQDR